jgi:hypothetical protein
VISTVNLLFINTDERKWQAVSDCFADEVLFDMTSMVGGETMKLTPQQIVDTWDTGLKGLKAIHHQAGNYIVALYSGHQRKRGRCILLRNSNTLFP